jgi:acetyl esterase/lipase
LYSAGANLALCLAFAAHDAGLALPAQIVTISPAADLSMANPDMYQVAPYDFRLSPEYCQKGSRLWAGVHIPPSAKPGSVPIPPEILANPHLNPIAGDLGIFTEHGTKLIIVSGQWDILHPDILVFVDKAEKAGVQMTYIEGEHQFHCFPVAVELYPETQQAAELINQQVKANGKS